MSKLRDIVNRPWNDVEIFADSIPHLLHWDFSYLWVLMKPEDQQPKNWKHRLLAWRKLVALFLLGKLRVQSEPMPDTFAAYLRQAGIHDLSVLYLDTTRVGLLSSVVLLRPFPDVTEAEVAAWPTPEKIDEDKLRYFAGILQRKLREGATSRVRQALARIIEQCFGSATAAIASYNGSVVPVALLPNLNWAEEATPETIEVLVSQWPPPPPTYVPLCGTCAGLLLRMPAEPPVRVTGGQLRLACAQGHENSLPLERLMLWERPSDVVVWADRRVPVAGEQPQFPPPVSVDEAEVRFTWNPGTIGGETQRTVLRLVFPNKAPGLRSFRDICFDRLLVPGADASRFRGIPIRPEWFEALEEPAQISVQASEGGAEIRRLKFKGWPFAFSTCLGRLGIERAKELGVGVFPRPMFASWKRYRVFACGAEGYQVTHPAKGTVVETKEGWPQVISVETLNGQAGATWYLPESCPAVERQPNVYIGLDFGTAYSVVYYGADGEGAPRPVVPAEISSRIYWISESGDSLPDFLPRSEDAHASDPYLVPSAQVLAEGRHLIRWSSRQPGATQALHGFKWDLLPRQFDQERFAFLDELLFLCVPEVLARLGIAKGPANLRVGFAYPLAFSHGSRSRLQELLGRLRGQVQQATGCEATAYSMNESRACVRAFGMFNPGQTFLIADMGGGTVDLAFCRFPMGDPRDFLQIGSLQFAGEAWLHALARQKAPTEAEREASYWKIRDALGHGQMMDRYPNDAQIARLVARFLPMALEFLRTMLAAFRQQHPNEPVKVLLVGNGWRLCELTAPAGLSQQQAFQSFYEQRLASFGLPGVELYHHAIPGVVSTKHLVAFGALRNAKTEQETELEKDAYPSRLPAGRRLCFTISNRPWTFEWHDLVGEAGNSFDMPAAVLKAATIDCDAQQGPPAPPGWQAWLQAALPSQPYPRAEELRQAIVEEIKGDSFLLKGPLQIVLEKHWRSSLERTEQGMAADQP